MRRHGLGQHLLIACGVLFATALPASTGAPQEVAAERYSGFNSTVEKGKRLFVERRFESSEKEFNKCVAAIPDHHEAHFYLSQIDYHRGEFDEALRHIDISIRSLLELGQRYMELQAKRKVEVEAKKQALHQLDQTHDNRGGVSCLTGSALSAERPIQTLDPDTYDDAFIFEAFRVPASHHFVRGNCLYRLNRLEEAGNQYLEAIKADPKHVGSWNNFINILFLQQKFDQAKEELKRAESQNVVVQSNLKQAVLKK